jgi:hypothetical protein
LLAQLRASGTKFNPDGVVDLRRLSDGRIVFLEQGNSRAGLVHIVKAHGEDFVRAGIALDHIPHAVMEALTTGKIIGFQGAGAGRPIYELANGQRIAVTVGTNGFVVGANPAGRK